MKWWQGAMLRHFNVKIKLQDKQDSLVKVVDVQSVTKAADEWNELVLDGTNTLEKGFSRSELGTTDKQVKRAQPVNLRDDPIIASRSLAISQKTEPSDWFRNVGIESGLADST
eukprot:NODE_326_length_9650_cov_0.368129.p5 type:complete len:113 gc:universal NODE_326_length_9650_cov_0.368129:5748-6086(+)